MVDNVKTCCCALPSLHGLEVCKGCINTTTAVVSTGEVKIYTLPAHERVFQCSKCKSYKVQVRHIAESVHLVTGAEVEERLRCKCERCDYKWSEKV